MIYEKQLDLDALEYYIQDPILINDLCTYQNLTETFIVKHFDKLHKILIWQNQILSEDFIKEHLNKLNRLDILKICRHQILSEKFIEANLSNLNIRTIIKHQHISDDFIKEHDIKNIKLKYDTNIDFININTNFKRDENFLYGYKKVRNDLHSVFQPSISYNIGENICSNEILNDLIGFTDLHTSKRYYPKSDTIYKVKTNIKDIKIFKPNNIRTKKLFILEKID